MAPCGKLEIILYEGTKDLHSQYLQDPRSDLITFPKGSLKSKLDLQERSPERYNYFTEIMNLKDSHMGKGLPDNYTYHLTLCNKSDCIHPKCQENSVNDITWYENGPIIQLLPFPIPDKERPWGASCNDCKNK